MRNKTFVVKGEFTINAETLAEAKAKAEFLFWQKAMNVQSLIVSEKREETDKVDISEYTETIVKLLA